MWIDISKTPIEPILLIWVLDLEPLFQGSVYWSILEFVPIKAKHGRALIVVCTLPSPFR